MDMTRFKMIYRDKVYYPLTMTMTYAGHEDGEDCHKIKFLTVVYINEDGEVREVEDEVWCFQFVRATGGDKRS